MARRIGKEYKKAVYREYTDDTFRWLKNRTADEQHLGILGPVLRAAVGDTIQVVFKNNAGRPYSMHPHGVFYSKEHEGVPSYGGMSGMGAGMGGNTAAEGGGGSVAPGLTWTYMWEVPERAGPGPNDGSSILWMYHSHVDENADVNAGLVGPILITRAGGYAASTTRPKDVTREFVVLFAIFDENSSHYLQENIATYMGGVSANGTVGNTDASIDELLMDPEFRMSNQKHAVNGFLYGNLQGLHMTVNETVRWHVLTVGSELDLHGVHWHGQTLLYDGHRVDVVELIPASMKTLDMRPDDPGTWLFHCHTNHHIVAGMTATFDVEPCLSPCPFAEPPPPAFSSAAKPGQGFLFFISSALLSLFIVSL